jgi:hypothetical protein
MPPLMPKRYIAHVACDSDSDLDSDLEDKEVTDGTKTKAYHVTADVVPGFEEDWLEPPGTNIYAIKWPHPAPEFVFVAHADEEIELFGDPNDSKWLMEVNGDTDIDEEEFCFMTKEPANCPERFPKGIQKGSQILRSSQGPLGWLILLLPAISIMTIHTCVT